MHFFSWQCFRAVSFLFDFLFKTRTQRYPVRLTSKFLVLTHKHASACPCPLGRHTSQIGNNQNTNYRRRPGNERQKRGVKEVSQWPRQMAMGLLAQVPFLFVICSNFILKSFPHQYLLLKPDALLHHCLLNKWYKTSLLLSTELVKHSGIDLWDVLFLAGLV